MTGEGAEEPSWAPAGFFQLRTPLLPFDEFRHLSAGLTAWQTIGRDDAEAAVSDDRTTLRARLRAWLDHPGVREAIHLASPVLDGRIDVWRALPPGSGGAGARRRGKL